MVNKRYMRKCDTCVGHEARINKLLLKKPPGIMSADSASIVCERGANEPLKGLLAHHSRATDVLSALIIPGGFFTRSLLIWASRPIHVSYFRMYLLFTIICIDMT